LAGRNWAERVSGLSPALAPDAWAVADALQGSEGGASRAAAITQAMRLTAQLRSHATMQPRPEPARSTISPIQSPFRSAPAHQDRPPASVGEAPPAGRATAKAALAPTPMTAASAAAQSAA